MISEIFKCDDDITCPKCGGEGMIPTKPGSSRFNNCKVCGGKRYTKK